MNPFLGRARAHRWAALCGAVAAMAMPAARSADSFPTLTFVANAENQTRPRVRYTGNPWTADQGGFLLGTGRGHRLLTEQAPGAGDFRVELELSLPMAARESAVVFGADSELVIAAGTKPWTLRGRFFRADDAPVEIAAPPIKAAQSFVLRVERHGEIVMISVDGVSVHRGPCSARALTALGVDPGAGAVRLYTLGASGAFSEGGTLVKPFGNPFGMQLRRLPSTAGAVREPVIIRGAFSNETSLVRRRDGSLENFFITRPTGDSVSVARSADGGLTWSEPEVAFPLPGRGYYAVQALEAGDGTLHAVAHVAGEGPGGYRGRLYEVYHTRRAPGDGAWSQPKRIVPGYVGSIRGFIQLRGSGRILLAVGRAVPAREQPPKTGPDYGWNDTCIYFSDDQGATWSASPDSLSVELKTTNATRYGAIEPVLLELRDGRVWMLIRDRQGRLFESYSENGSRWSAPAPTAFISSDSPAGVLRLRNGKIVLLLNACQNWTDPRSYAMGGREVLHAAISDDEGKTWRGFREIFHETDIVSGGDRGTAYPTLAETADGKILVATGQGEGKRGFVIFDPRWLEEREQRDELLLGPSGWTAYGDEGLHIETVDGQTVIAVPLKATGLAGALWNFPLGDSGEVRGQVQLPPQAGAVRFSLNDHFNRIDDKRASEHAVCIVDAEKINLPRDGRWHDVVVLWSHATTTGEVRVEVDGRPAGRFMTRRAAQFGINYLRVESHADADAGNILIRNLSARIPR